MRIAIEYQLTETTRFVTYAGATHQNAKWVLELPIF
jgi:hypothetical protein